MDDDRGVSPPPSVLRAWAVTEPSRLDGGQGLSFSAGGLVLKPAGDLALAVWLAEVLDEVSADGVRVIRPVRFRSGQWVVDGWSAWQWLEGEHRSDAWDEVLQVSARFHRAVADVRWSPAVVASQRWAVADRVAWGETDADLPALVVPLLARRRPVDLPRPTGRTVPTPPRLPSRRQIRASTEPGARHATRPAGPLHSRSRLFVRRTLPVEAAPGRCSALMTARAL